MANTNPPTPAPKSPTKLKPKASSTKAHNGSSKSGQKPFHKHPSSSHHDSSAALNHDQGTTQSNKAPTVERFIHSERDYRSFAVKEFDEHQEHARRKHDEDLNGVVGMNY